MFRRIIKRYRLIVESAAHSHWHSRASKKAKFAGGQFTIEHGTQISMPIRADGRGNVLVGKNVKLGYRKAPKLGNGELLLQARSSSAEIKIGDGTATSNNLAIIANESIDIGKNCLIGDLVSIFDSDFHAIRAVDRKTDRGQSAPITIEDNVWLGSRVVVLKGVTIGQNSVIAAGSVVVDSIPANVIAGGVPARPLKSVDA